MKLTLMMATTFMPQKWLDTSECDENKRDDNLIPVGVQHPLHRLHHDPRKHPLPWLRETLGSIHFINSTVTLSSTHFLGYIATLGSIHFLGYIVTLGSIHFLGYIATLGSIHFLGYIATLGSIHFIDYIEILCY
ncbi:transcription factor with AP2 domain(S), putative (ApiAP2) [Elysia marginata]|uniref:Transcription factor with AP2 domain(S), putative (ApiAP2) n=1 Tax=Elysia marginata TaxID=1093978 RepID=A0AAV4JJK8_9GAST|nr:transcription factor with AP2 domain(S), putative (ApiAP2) [Elysia marginata]